MRGPEIGARFGIAKLLVSEDEAVRGWVREGIAALKSKPFVQDDWDELPGGLVEPPSAKRALHIFEIMVVSLLTANRPDLRAMLFMPLPYSNRFSRRTPSFERFVEQPWPEGRRREMTGAGFYLIRIEELGWFGNSKEY